MVFEFTNFDGKLFHTGIVLIANEFNLIDLFTQGLFSFILCPLNAVVRECKKLAHVKQTS